MDIALLAGRLALAAVFAVAGATKLADLAGSREALRGFGVPSALAGMLGLLLPLAELGIAAVLLPASSAWWGALAAFALLLLFVAAIGLNMAAGRRPDCHCFGQLHSEPVGASTLVRNVVLAAVAGFLVWQGQVSAGPSAIGWLGDLSLAELLGLVGGLATLVLLAAMVWMLLQLTSQNGRLLKRLDRLEERLAGDGAAPTRETGSPTPNAPPGDPRAAP